LYDCFFTSAPQLKRDSLGGTRRTAYNGGASFLFKGGLRARSPAPATRHRDGGRQPFPACSRTCCRCERSGRLFHSSDPTLNANKQAAYHIVKDLLEAGHWELADKYLTDRYIQHNPNAASGRAGVVRFFTEIRKVKPTPIPEKMTTKVVSVVAEGDLVVVAYVHEVKEAKDPSKSYTTTWFDMWRFKDGKADEHWDPATRLGQ